MSSQRPNWINLDDFIFVVGNCLRTALVCGGWKVLFGIFGFTVIVLCLRGVDRVTTEVEASVASVTMEAEQCASMCA